MAHIEEMKKWRIQSPVSMGFHSVITPDTSSCKVVQIYRLNLAAGSTYELNSHMLEMHGVLIDGEAVINHDGLGTRKMKKFDSFYVPSCEKVVITAIKECIFYIPAAECNHIGMPIFRTFDATLNIGDIHQIHGTGSGQREVMFTLAPTDKASHLICGLTWSGDGTWTSWPPHQHEKYLEEVYCYFDMPKPKFGFHISYENSGDVDDMVVHTVYSGTMVQAPWGYHPTVASPGSRNAYLWVLGAFDPTVRRYDLAELDPLRI